MRSLRVFLLVLLTVLLPLRGALAAAIMCPPAGSGVQTEVRMAGQAQGHDHAHAHEGHAGSSDHHDHADAGGAADKCNLCSAFCSVAGMVSSGAAIPEPGGVAAVFPSLFAAPPSFFPDGQERPPRSI